MGRPAGASGRNRYLMTARHMQSGGCIRLRAGSGRRPPRTWRPLPPGRGEHRIIVPDPVVHDRDVAVPADPGRGKHNRKQDSPRGLGCGLTSGVARANHRAPLQSAVRRPAAAGLPVRIQKSTENCIFSTGGTTPRLSGGQMTVAPVRSGAKTRACHCRRALACDNPPDVGDVADEARSDDRGRGSGRPDL